MDEKDLISHCIKKNQLAQKILFDTYYKRMFNIAMRYLSNVHDAEEVITNSFLRIFNKISTFEDRGVDSLKKWIKTIVINESIRFLNRRKALQFENDLSLVENEFQVEDTCDSFEIEEIYKIIEGLPQGYKTVFNLYIIEGYSHIEISELLNISESTSKSQLFKARKLIIKNLNK